ncbi:MAG: hypothetical protein ABL951_01045 [Alphaproteobacteria bacterium]
MGIRITKAFQPLTPERLKNVHGYLGVYHLAEPDGAIYYIGYAGGRSLFGLNGELKREMQAREGRPALFRCEVNMQYLSRHEELLMLHVADHGELPERNRRELNHKLGRLTPA